MLRAGVYISTLQFECLPISDGDDDDDITPGPFELFFHALRTFETRLRPNLHLGSHGIHPSSTHGYARNELANALKSASGVYPYVWERRFT